MTTGNVKITTNGTKLAVESPYHPGFITKARNLNGKWSSPAWVFDPRDESRVREACVDVYGTDGTEVPTVDVRINCDQYPGSGPAWYGLGRLLIERKARDYGVRLGNGVSAISGGFPSFGGSVKHPRPEPKEGTILMVRDVPVALAQRFAVECKGVEIVTPEPTSATPDPKIEIVAEIKNLMQLHGITIADLLEG